MTSSPNHSSAVPPEVAPPVVPPIPPIPPVAPVGLSDVWHGWEARWNAWTRGQQSVALGSAFYVLLFALMLWLRPGGTRVVANFVNIFQTVGTASASFALGLCAWRGHFEDKSGRVQRVGWALLCVGFVLNSLGDLTWLLVETVLKSTVSSPGWGDVWYLGGYPFMICGLLCVFASLSVPKRARFMLDNAVTTCSVAALSWFYVLQPILEQGAAATEKYVSLSYPIYDIGMFFGGYLLLNASDDARVRRFAVPLGLGVIVLGMADTLFVFTDLRSGYQAGGWMDAGWAYAYVLVGLAALMRLWSSSAAAHQVAKASAPSAPSKVFEPEAPKPEAIEATGSASATVWRVLTPYIAFAATFLTIALHEWSQAGAISSNLLMAGLAMLALVLFRQAMTLVENVRLTRQLSALNEDLEGRVRRRTAQMDALLQLTKAVSNTLLSEQVLARAVEQTSLAMGADAVALWLVDDFFAETGSIAPLRVHRGLEDQPAVLRYLSQLPLLETRRSIQLHVHVDESGAQSDDVMPIGALQCEPMRWHGRLLGMIGAIRWEEESFAPDEMLLLESIGLEVGAALENAQMYSAAVEAADRDAATGLLNHRAIQGRYDAAFARAEQSGTPLSVIMMDLNNFKLFNDTYGHPSGDQVLKQVARVLADNCRAGDMVGRYGGDEFMMILPGADSQHALEAAARLRDRMAEEGYRPSGEDSVIPVTLSFGVASYPQDSQQRHDLVSVADKNLYVAKNSKNEIRGTSEVKRSRGALMTHDSFMTLDAVVNAVDNKDSYTRQHSEDVTEYALWIAQELGLSQDTQRLIRIGGMLHDVGKIGVPDDILKKPAALSSEEFAVMKQHPWIGSLIVGTMPGMEGIVEIVRFHHERFDGRGYPDGLLGEDIPLLGRLLAVADAFSAMTTARPYRKGLSWEAALQTIRACSGTQFDPQMAEAFLNAVEKRERAQNLETSAAAMPELSSVA